jgi:AraC family transcriptional regulator
MAADDAGDVQEERVLARGGLAGWQVRALTQLVAREIASLTVGRMATAVDLSPHHFSRAFRTTFGAPPRSWLIDAKMLRARDRLLNSNDTVEQIAIALGYRSGSQFSRVFRAQFGTSPLAFRRS